MIRVLINVYIVFLIFDAILSYFPNYYRTDWGKKIKMTADFTCKHVRKHLPPDLPFDISPVIVILSLKLIELLW